MNSRQPLHDLSHLKIIRAPTQLHFGKRLLNYYPRVNNPLVSTLGITGVIQKTSTVGKSEFKTVLNRHRIKHLNA